MTVTEAKMGWGDFSIPLLPNTPREITQHLMLPSAAFGHVRIFPQRITTDQALQNRASDMFCGVMTRRPDRFTIEGHSATMLLGENSGSTDLYSEELGPIASITPIAHDGNTSGSVTQWVTDALNITNCPIQLGTVLGSGLPAGTLRGAIFIRKTPKTLLDMWICHVFDVVYRVNPDLTLDIGQTTDLWPFTQPYPLAIRRGGRDLNVDGMNAVELNMEVDYSDWTSRVITYIESPSAIGEFYTSHPYRSPRDGNTFNWTKLQSGQSAAQGTAARAQADAVAQSARSGENAVRTRQVTLSTNEYAVTRRVNPGEFIFVYSVEDGLWDQSWKIPYQGRLTFPVQLRVEAVTWPLQRGMSCIWDNRHTTLSGKVIDLTDYIDWEKEQGDTVLTVGSPPPTLGRMLRLRH